MLRQVGKGNVEIFSYSEDDNPNLAADTITIMNSSPKSWNTAPIMTLVKSIVLL